MTGISSSTANDESRAYRVFRRFACSESLASHADAFQCMRSAATDVCQQGAVTWHPIDAGHKIGPYALMPCVMLRDGSECEQLRFFTHVDRLCRGNGV